MAFRFALQSVLRLRRGVENQEEQKLLAIVSAAGRVRTEIERLAEVSVQQHRRENEELAAGTAVGAMLQFNARCDERRRALRVEWLAKLAELEQKRTEQAAEYRKARQKREIMEGLRDHQKATYDREFQKREQERADEAFLMRKINEERE
jgi:flagellar export protein FliJ